MSYVSNKGYDKYVEEEFNELYKLISYCLVDGIAVDGIDEKMKFTMLDYYFLTDVPNNNFWLLARRRVGFSDPVSRTAISKFFDNARRLNMNKVSVDKMTKENNCYGYGDQIFYASRELWEDIFEQFTTNNIPHSRDLLSTAFYRVCRGEPIFPLEDYMKQTRGRDTDNNKKVRKVSVGNA